MKEFNKQSLKPPMSKSEIDTYQRRWETYRTTIRRSPSFDNLAGLTSPTSDETALLKQTLWKSRWEQSNPKPMKRSPSCADLPSLV